MPIDRIQLARLASWIPRERGAPVSIEARRASERDWPDPREIERGDGIEVTFHEISGRIPAWVYRPPGGAAAKGAHLVLHDGGFYQGSPKKLDPLARRCALAADCVVVSAGYRLAPEHPWPAAPDDAYAVLEWVAGSAAALGIDVARLSIGGVSAGANLAAVVALMARDRGGPALIFQQLEIPALDLTLSSESARRTNRIDPVGRADLEMGYAVYVTGGASRTDPYVSPLFADDLAGLPPAFVLTAQFDILRDEGEAYARRLREAGVPAAAMRAKGQVHPSVHSELPSAQRYQAIAAAALARAHRAAVGEPDGTRSGTIDR